MVTNEQSSKFVRKKIYAKLYEYFGLIVLFYSHEHEPIHVHCKYQGKESKAEIIYEDGKFVKVVIKKVVGKEPLDIQNLKKFKRLVESVWALAQQPLIKRVKIGLLFLILRIENLAHAN